MPIKSDLYLMEDNIIRNNPLNYETLKLRLKYKFTTLKEGKLLGECVYVKAQVCVWQTENPNISKGPGNSQSTPRGQFPQRSEHHEDAAGTR